MPYSKIKTCKIPMQHSKMLKNRKVSTIMNCSLCYESREAVIDFESDEAKRMSIATILYKHFPFCFNEEPKCGVVCRKCWCKVDVFHQFFVRIEEIQGICYRDNYIESNKCDTTSNETKDLIINEDIKFLENDTNENFDNISVDHNYFDDHSDEDDDDDDDDDHDHTESDLPAMKEETDTKQQLKNVPRIKRKYNKQAKFNRPKCDHCAATFMTISKLRKHLKEKHAEFAFRCQYYSCVETFATADLLDKHKEKHVKIPCPQCNKMIQSKGMKKHIRQIHEIDQRIVCDLCGKVSSSIFMHRYHVRSDHEVHEKLQCDICKEWYKNKENLRSHMKSIHVEGPQTCTICGRISTNMKALSKHKKIHLEGSKERFKCIVCGKGFRDRTKLKEHSYIHTGVTDAYVCQFCGKAFRFGSSMYAHRKKAHPNEMNALKFS